MCHHYETETLTEWERLRDEEPDELEAEDDVEPDREETAPVIPPADD